MGNSITSVEIMTALYYGEFNNSPIFKVDPANPDWDAQDYFVVSRSVSSVVQYAILSDKDFFHSSEMDFFGNLGSKLISRSNGKVPGVSVSSIDFAHAVSGALGLALSLKMDRKPNRVFVLLDVSELQNGQLWEVVLYAVQYNLNNLIFIVDDCGFQADGPVRSSVDIGYLQSKFDSFGWQVVRVNDGHDFDQLLDAYLKVFTVNRRPACIWCNTVAGKGVDFAERKHGYFNAVLSQPELELIISNLSKTT